MLTQDNYTLRILDILDNRLDFVLKIPYISGMGYGYKTINNRKTNIPSLTFFVDKKLSPHEIDPYYRIPKYINEVHTDVVEDTIYTLATNESRPAYGGLSVSNAQHDIPGTIAYPVTERLGKTNLYILSCSHVLNCFPKTIKQYNDVIQPAIKFGGIPPKNGKKDFSYIGELTRFTQLNYFDSRYSIPEESAMEIDAAIAKVGPNNSNTRKFILDPFLKVGPKLTPTSLYTTLEPALDMKIWTITSTSNRRIYGMIHYLNVSKIVSLEGKFMMFKNQFIAYRFNDSREFALGDSGSLAVWDHPTMPALGMLISIPNNNNKALFTPIRRVLNELDVVLATPDDRF